MTTGQRRSYTQLFIEFMGKEIPGCRIAYKDDPPETIPWWHRVSHFVAGIVTPEYATRYTTVIYPVIYLPEGARDRFESKPELYYATLRHEFVHLKDFQRFHLWMGITYAVLLPVVWTMRAYWELRGYAQNMIFSMERSGDVPMAQIDRLTEIFAGRGYVYMLLPASRARRVLMALRQQVCSGELSGPYPYSPLDCAPPEPEDVL